MPHSVRRSSRTCRSCLAQLVIIGSAAGATWTRLESPHFEIYTDVKERVARDVLTRFEQAHRALSPSQWKDSSERPTRVLLFSTERDYAPLRPAANVRGFYQSGPERDYIVMLAGAELDRVILHEYTHSVLNHTSPPLPQWLEEGVAELYSTVSIGERSVIVGAPIPEHLVTLAGRKWLTADQLSSVKQGSDQYDEAAKTGIFYAQSWALTHMLTFGERYRTKLPEFLKALTAGDDPPSAFEKAFGQTMNAAISDLPGYIRPGFRSASVETPGAERISLSSAILLAPAEAQQVRGEVLLLMGRDREAQSVYESAAKRYPTSAAAMTGLAVIAMRAGDYARARDDFQRAIELGARDGSTYFEYAMLLRDTGAAPQKVDEFLEKAVVANPAHAEAHFLLGIRASDAERYAEAIEHLRRATAVLPRQAYFWQALAYAYYKTGNSAEAHHAALVAMRNAHTEHETEMARNALNLTEPADTVRPQHAGTITPDSWTNPRGDRSVSGELIQVDCGKEQARLHLRVGGETTILNVKDPRLVTIRGGSRQHVFACGPQRAVGVLVEFLGASNEVTAIEFR